MVSKAVIDGREVLCGNRKLMEAQHVDIGSYRPSSFGTEVLIAIDGIFSGHLTISDTIKEDARSSITALKKLGLTTIMLTGDAQESAGFRRRADRHRRGSCQAAASG